MPIAIVLMALGALVLAGGVVLIVVGAKGGRRSNADWPLMSTSPLPPPEFHGPAIDDTTPDDTTPDDTIPDDNTVYDTTVYDTTVYDHTVEGADHDGIEFDDDVSTPNSRPMAPSGTGPALQIRCRFPPIVRSPREVHR